ncbi:hypothetical protein KIL84_012279 [Mauremys mutica]|uniref:Uncharacterized protein n=1 Tax=Mauremys mutica TaxID=74926 RepID=A0A9D3XF93_9SAUR|nr:hypothetical protein KIL84_012279 [Mauremys mutica]
MFLGTSVQPPPLPGGHSNNPPPLSLSPIALCCEPALGGSGTHWPRVGPQAPWSLAGWEQFWGIPQCPHAATASADKNRLWHQARQPYKSPAAARFQVLIPAGGANANTSASLAALGNSYSGLTAECCKEGLCPSPISTHALERS